MSECGCTDEEMEADFQRMLADPVAMASLRRAIAQAEAGQAVPYEPVGRELAGG